MSEVVTAEEALRPASWMDDGIDYETCQEDLQDTSDGDSNIDDVLLTDEECTRLTTILPAFSRSRWFIPGTSTPASPNDDGVAWLRARDASPREIAGWVRRLPPGATAPWVRSFGTAAPDDARWRCLRWLESIHQFAFDGLVASFGADLGIRGTPTVYLWANKPDSMLVWGDAPGTTGYVFLPDGFATPCGVCVGCLAQRPNHRASASEVYFIQSSAGGPIKIGRSADPRGRLATLQTAHAHPLAVLGTMPGGAAIERTLHRTFAADRIRPGGEWFRPSADLLAFIRELGTP